MKKIGLFILTIAVLLVTCAAGEATAKCSFRSLTQAASASGFEDKNHADGRLNSSGKHIIFVEYGTGNYKTLLMYANNDQYITTTVQVAGVTGKC